MTSEISFKLDWLTVTFGYGKLKVPETETDVEKLMGELAELVGGNRNIFPLPGRQGYRYVGDTDLGATVMAGDTERQGLCIVLSAEVIQRLGGTAQVCNWLRRMISEFGARVTRYDMAIDFIGNDAPSVAQLANGYQFFLDARGRAKPKTHQFLGSDGTLETAYFGSRKSDRMIRVYDKAREQRIEKIEQWTRFEIEYKGELAKRFDGNFDAAIETALTEMTSERNHNDARWDKYLRMMRQAVVTVYEPYAKPPRKSEDANTLGWWQKSVIASLRSKMKEDPELGAEMFAMIAKAYREEYEQSGKR